MASAAESTDVDIDEMSVKALRELITSSGLSFSDCVEKVQSQSCTTSSSTEFSAPFTNNHHFPTFVHHRRAIFGLGRGKPVSESLKRHLQSKLLKVQALHARKKFERSRDSNALCSRKQNRTLQLLCCMVSELPIVILRRCRIWQKESGRKSLGYFRRRKVS